MVSSPRGMPTRGHGRHLQRWLKGLLAVMGSTGIFFLAMAGTAAYLLYQHVAEDLPEISLLKISPPSLITTLYAADGSTMAHLFVERRILVPLDKIPPLLKQATLAVEDARFYAHAGIDWRGMARAAWANLHAGGVVEGASTITQQVAKMRFLTPRKTVERKLREMILALRMERILTKDEILEIYLNQSYYGHGAYGVEAAATVYFGKHVEELTLPEAALLAGLPKAPTAYSPYTAPDRAQRRRAHVLQRMVEIGAISPDDVQRAHEASLPAPMRQDPAAKAPYFTEYVRRSLEEQYGSTLLYRGGLQVHTTLDPSMQEAAEAALRQGLLTNDRRRGYRGPLGHVALARPDAINWEQVRQIPWPEEPSAATVPSRRVKAIVVGVDEKRAHIRWEGGEGIIPLEAMGWAYAPDLEKDSATRKLRRVSEALTVGDVILADIVEPGEPGKKTQLALAQEPVVQGALVALEPHAGAIRALVGGYAFSRSQFNRATQAIRQPGSAFKPVIYATAIHRGYTPAHVILDAPLVYQQSNGTLWKPSNYDHTFWGPVTLAEALAHSRNIVTIKLLDAVGVHTVVEYAKGLGIKSPLAPTLALGLGASSLTPMELTTALSVFANQGLRCDPFAVTRVEDGEGRVLEQHTPVGERVMSAQEAFVMTSLLQGVVQRGTAKAAQTLGRPVAGKTGTTNDFIDAWFVGYSPQLVAGVWVGIDDRTPLGSKETGGRAALPIWIAFMQQALAHTPVEEFTPPPQVQFVRIHPRTGASGAVDGRELIQVAVPEPPVTQARRAPRPEHDEPMEDPGAVASPRWRDLGLTGAEAVPHEGASPPPQARPLNP